MCPRHTVVGCRHGHFDRGETSEIVELIRYSKADVLLVAMGNPKQELFIHEHLAGTGCRLGIGVGALFDFLAGDVPRAPLWVQRWRLEWVYRLLQEPEPPRAPLPGRQSSVPDADLGPVVVRLARERPLNLLLSATPGPFFRAGLRLSLGNIGARKAA